MNLSDLKKPFDPKRVSWRVGPTTKDKQRAQALCYVDSRDVQDRLDEAVGVENWQCRYSAIGSTIVCAIGIKIDGEWVWKEDGAGASDIEAEKGGLSGAFKRSAVKWGISRYLYDVNIPWIEIEPAGNSYKIKPSEMPKLVAALSGATAPQTRPEPPPTPVASKTIQSTQQPSAAKSGAGEQINFSEEAKVAISQEFFRNSLQEVRAKTKLAEVLAWVKLKEASIAKAKPHDPKGHRDLMNLIEQKEKLLNPAHSG